MKALYEFYAVFAMGLVAAGGMSVIYVWARFP